MGITIRSGLKFCSRFSTAIYGHLILYRHFFTLGNTMTWLRELLIPKAGVKASGSGLVLSQSLSLERFSLQECMVITLLRIFGIWSQVLGILMFSCQINTETLRIGYITFLVVSPVFAVLDPWVCSGGLSFGFAG
jgi:hypothetical protein